MFDFRGKKKLEINGDNGGNFHTSSKCPFVIFKEKSSNHLGLMNECTLMYFINYTISIHEFNHDN
jgi:hypothetical protein